MSTVQNEQNELTKADARELVHRSAVLMRSRPVPGSDPVQAQAWRDEVLAFLHTPTMILALGQLGITPPKDFSTPPADDHGAALEQLVESLDSGEDFLPALIIVTVEVAYIGLVGYAIYSHVTQEPAPEPAPTP